MADETQDPTIVRLQGKNEKRKRKPGLRIIPGYEAAEADLSDNDHLIDGILPKGGLVALYGAPGATKSFWALNAALSIARGEPVHGREVQSGEVLYICQEGQRNFRRRVAAYCVHHGITEPDDIMQQLCQFDLIEDPVDLQSSSSRSLDDILQALDDGEIKPSLVVIDTLARTFGSGNENSPESMGSFLATIGRLQSVTGATVLLIHHSGKDVAQGMRGHSSLLGAVDVELKITKSDAGSLLTVSKMRDGEDGVQFAYRIEPVTLGTTPKGKDVTSCVVLGASIEDVKPQPSVRLGANEEELVKQVDLLTTEPDCPRTPYGIGWPETPVPMARQSDVVSRAVKNLSVSKDKEAEQNLRRNLSRALTRLADRKRMLGRNDGYVWLIR